MIARYAVKSLMEALESQKFSLETLRTSDFTSEHFITWQIHLALSGVQPSTARRYTGKIRHLLEEAGYSGMGKETDLPVGAEGLWEEISGNLATLKTMLLHRRHLIGDTDFQIFLFLLYNPSMTIEDAIRLRHADLLPLLPQEEEIAEAARGARQRKYLFPLSQGKQRDKAIAADISRRLRRLYRSHGLDPRHSMASLWIAAALEAGVTYREILACVARLPEDYALLENLRTWEAAWPSVDRREVEQRVADRLAPLTENWYVMRLRSGASAAEITRRLESRHGELMRSLTLYYPVREEITIKNRKKIRRETPWLPGLLFFRSNADVVPPLFRAIGDMAWCFRTSSLPGSQYAVIPRREMEHFQRRIGRFTEDIRIELSDRASLGKGRRVRITGGVMKGYEGIIYDVKDSSEDPHDNISRIFTLELSSESVIRWTIEVEDFHIEPVE